MPNGFAWACEAVGHATPNRLFCRRAVENNAIEAEASACATLRVNGTGCRARARPWTRCRAMRSALLRAGSADCLFASTQHPAIEAEAGPCASLRVNGTGCRATALPKVRTLFEDAQAFRK